MATVKRFEELDVWQLARVQCQEFKRLKDIGAFTDDFPLQDQMNRSTGSVMDNISEGFDRFTKADFRHFLIIARGSNAEARSQLYRALDRNYISQPTFDWLNLASIELGVKLHNFINYLTGSEHKHKPNNNNYRSGQESANINEPDNAYYRDASANSYNFPEAFISSSNK